MTAHLLNSTLISPELVLEPVSRWPLRLPDETIATVLASPIPDRASVVADGGAPSVSIVTLTRNGLAVTKLCLTTLIANTDYPDYEVIVVDNGSTDGTRDYLRDLAQVHPHIKPMLYEENLGFAAGNNQALAVASGDTIVLLNNDTIVPPGWLRGMVRHLDDPAIGLVGPTSNRCGNEAEIETRYRTYGGLLSFADTHQRHSNREFTDIRTAIMYCVGMRRDVLEQVGRLDERFEIGMFEDDDYAMRVREAGYRVGYASDLFVHHFGQASIGQLAESGEYGPLFHANRQRFEEKWQTTWTSHEGRPKPDYERLRERVRETVEAHIPPGKTVLVASKGDEALLRFADRTGWHFPQAINGAYAGHHPRDSWSAIGDIGALHAQGAEYVLIPSTLFWWLDHYPEFNDFLTDLASDVVFANEDCLLVSLSGRSASALDRSLA